MNGEMFWITFNIASSFITGTVNLAYFITHGNGKRLLRLFSAFVIFVFTAAYVLAAVGVIDPIRLGPDYLRPWVNLLYLVPTLDTLVDWKPIRKGKQTRV